MIGHIDYLKRQKQHEKRLGDKHVTRKLVILYNRDEINIQIILALGRAAITSGPDDYTGL